MILDKKQGPQIMGVVNVTPDSFSDGGNLMLESRINIDSVLRLVAQMIEDGVDIVDIGGESTRPSRFTADVNYIDAIFNHLCNQPQYRVDIYT